MKNNQIIVNFEILTQETKFSEFSKIFEVK